MLDTKFRIWALLGTQWIHDKTSALVPYDLSTRIKVDKVPLFGFEFGSISGGFCARFCRLSEVSVHNSISPLALNFKSRDTEVHSSPYFQKFISHRLSVHLLSSNWIFNELESRMINQRNLYYVYCINSIHVYDENDVWRGKKRICLMNFLFARFWFILIGFFCPSSIRLYSILSVLFHRLIATTAGVVNKLFITSFDYVGNPNCSFLCL